MSNNSLDGRIKDLQQRFNQELRLMGDRSNLNLTALGDGRRPRPPPFAVSAIASIPPPRPSEADVRLREVHKMSGKLKINNISYKSQVSDLKQLGELGSGTCGQVVKMLHVPSGAVIAVKQMRRSGNSEETKRILMDLDVVVRSHGCPYIVKCLGCFITDSDVWICMEMMASCFDKLLKRLGSPIPEPILGKVAVATVRALSYLKEEHGVIHRDVKPSNVLLDECGNIKLCDFGISGRLVDSKAKTRTAGCAAYLAPERIEPPDPTRPDYDIRADVWSLGISLVELATGMFPYKDCQNDFQVLAKVLEEKPPTLPDTSDFTPEFKSFVEQCLTKDYGQRPKYAKLLEHPFVKRWSRTDVDIASWYASITKRENAKRRSFILEAETDAPGVSAVQPMPEPSPLFQPRLGAAMTDRRTKQQRLTSISQPPSLEAARDSYSPYLRRRSVEQCNPISRTPELRRRPSPAPSSKTSPIVVQRYYHQSQQRPSRMDYSSAAAHLRHRSLSNETSRSPDPPPRKNPPLPSLYALNERLHPPPSPIQQRIISGRSNSMSRAEATNDMSPTHPYNSSGDLLERLSPEYFKRGNGHVKPSHHQPHLPEHRLPGIQCNPNTKSSHNDQGWLVSLAGLVRRRLGSYVKNRLVGPNSTAAATATASTISPSPQNARAQRNYSRELLGSASPRTRWRKNSNESWSMPCSPKPPRVSRPTAAD